VTTKNKNILETHIMSKTPNSGKAGYKVGDYVRPAVTKTDQLTPDEIAKLIEDYRLVDDLHTVPLGTHLRYFTPDPNTGELKFKYGGLLHRNNGLNDGWIMLSNGTTKPWSVQIKGCKFYKKMTDAEIKQEYNNMIDAKNAKLQEYKDRIRMLENELDESQKAHVKDKVRQKRLNTKNDKGK
jgi:hypothetical protein